MTSAAPQLSLAKPGLAKASLRPYQIEAIERLREHVAAGRRRLLLTIPTGGGKTLTAAELMRSALTYDKRVLFVVHLRELVDQTVRALERCGISHVGVLRGDDERVDPSAQIQVASIQTLARRDRPEADIVILDEAHRSLADSYVTNIWEAYRDAIIIGLTATPCRGDGRPLAERYEELVVGAIYSELIAANFVADPIVYAPRVEPDMSSVRKVAGDWDAEQVEQMMTGLAGEIIPTWLEYAGGRSTIVFASGIRHSRDIVERFTKVGVTAEHLDGETPGDERAAILDRLADGSTTVVSNCLDEHTEILTARGWAGIDTIAEDDFTASMSVADGSLEFQPISRVVRRDRSPGERMVSIRNQTLDIRVTEGHRMVTRAPGAVRWSVVTAGDLVSRGGPYHLPMAANLVPPPIDVPSGTVAPQDLTLDQCRFIGLWIADGWLDRGKGCRGVVIGQSARYVSANVEIRRILNACGFDWRETTSRAVGTPHLQHRYGVPRGSIGGELARRGFDSIAHYLDKDFSEALFGLSRAQTLALIDGFWLGDGFKEVSRNGRARARSGWRVCNTNKTSIDRFQILTITRGIACNVFGPLRNGPKSTKPIYNIGFRARSVVTTNNRSVATSGGNPATFDSGWRSERVWCVTNANGTIVTRRNGKVAITGQCSVLTEGFDSPGIRCAVIARPTLSLVLHMQTAGRALRPGPIRPVIIDHAGNVGRHGLPHEDRAWSIVGPAKRLAPKSPYRTCGKCFAYYVASANECPHCGFVPPIVERELPVETPAAVEIVTTALLEKNFYVSAVNLARSRGFKPGMASFKFKEKFGKWPPWAWSQETKMIFGNDTEWQRRLDARQAEKAHWAAVDAAAEAAKSAAPEPEPEPESDICFAETLTAEVNAIDNMQGAFDDLLGD